ncbi:YbaB/EbfC family nucleoid-associated protein [Saccharopolyspora erythraea]|uniref:YbaB/EbfC family nucleoid-associated protein n=1 Tax=Saccharopolyspora erythraea TaxID=1836 RepID=UPI001BA6BD87|nr:YbaB/EbfC family nucleoid-associated protein [Saccharopolyspora erythraea]QUH00446.1 YbaB/EbfC family nucleoid-associated protein [Saccharopolyspora erythraea]
MRDAMHALDTALAEQRFVMRSRNGAAQAEVDGNGGLIDVKVDDRALHSGHPEIVGPAIVEAIGAARAQAADAALGQLRDAAAGPGSAAGPGAVGAQPGPRGPMPQERAPQPGAPGHPTTRYPAAARPAAAGRPQDEGTSLRPHRGVSVRRDPDDLENEVPLFGGLQE